MNIKGLYNKIVLHRWDLAFLENTLEGVLAGNPIRMKRVKYPFHKRWFADPFILDYDDEKILLLVEDFSDSDKKGKISKLVINRRTMELEDMKTILELDSHLSFPAIIRKEGKIFIYPENSQGGGLWLYDYNEETDKCEKIRQLSERPLTDAVITTRFGDKLIFSTEEPHPNQNKLGVYSLNENDQYVFSRHILFDENIARNAGDFFEYNGQIYRAAQECNSMYGHALSIQRITREGGILKMEEVRRIMPPGLSRFGMHTFNVYKDLIVVDLKVFRYPWIAVPLFKLRNVFKKNAR